MHGKTVGFVLAATLAAVPSLAAAADACNAQATFAIVAHGGALSEKMDGDARLAVMKAALTKARASEPSTRQRRSTRRSSRA